MAYKTKQMTKDFDIKSIAVIGGGYSGLSTLADLVHTAADGHSTIATAKVPVNPAFNKVKLFELNSRIGGAWNHSVVTDPALPPQHLLEKQYWEPEETVIFQKSSDDTTKEIKWARSAVYDDMYTNVSSDFMTLSTQEKKKYPERAFSPFITQKEVLRLLIDFVEQYDLNRFINYNSSVQTVLKDDNEKYQLTIKETNPLTGEIKWYTETFDAIVAATGRFQYPHIPKIKNLAEFNAKNPGIIKHTKVFRKATDYAGSKVLLVGSGTSAVGVLEFLKPLAKEIYVSRRTKELDPINEKFFRHYESIFEQINDVGEIVDLDAETGEVTFFSGEKVKGFDHIILGTGFHIHYPYLSDLAKSNKHIVQIGKANGDQRGLIRNLFHYTFNIEEPTLATVGLASSGFFVHLAESQGAAIAGVWSNARRLPGIEEQKQWETERLETHKNQRVIHGYSTEEAKEEIEYLNREFSPFGRPKVSDRLDLKLFDHQLEHLGKIFVKFANGEFDEKYVARNDFSGLTTIV